MRIYGLIGKSLDHSWSAAYFNDKFIRENITGCAYRNFPLSSIKDLPQLLLREPGLAGLNITIPYKSEVIQFLGSVDPEAASIEAVNCIKIERKGDHFQLVGYNTDVAAFSDSLHPLIQKHHQRALVLGTGGAARAVCQALNRMGINYSMVSRKESTENLMYPALNGGIIADHQIIINATPCGMHPDAENFPPIPYESISGKHLVYDLIYNPEETIFLKRAGLAGAVIKNGLEMLHLQAELSWKTWNSL